MGRAIAEYQAISFKIARMEARAHAARMAWYDAAAKMVKGLEFRREAYIAKLISSEAAMDNARDATQIHGGYGYIKEYKVERFYRDARITSIYEGTSQVQKLVISGNLLK